MNECSKAVTRRLHSPGFVTHYFVGDGIDVGSGSDAMRKWSQLFPLIRLVTDFDLPDGDAQFLDIHENNQFDFLHSSHCLEHVRDPLETLRNWIRVVRPGGHLVILIPDEDLYEQGVWPSTFNRDHKHTFTIYKQKSWSPVSINLTDLIAHVADLATPLKIEQLHQTFLSDQGRKDQTLTPVTESAIELLLRKHPAK